MRGADERKAMAGRVWAAGPDLSTFSRYFRTIYTDLTDKIDGPETAFNYYIKTNPQEDVDYILVNEASVDGKIFMYSVGKQIKGKKAGSVDGGGQRGKGRKME